jgi:hypothetical protein
VARRSKKSKPTFDVAREPIGETKSGWVYRSESVHTPTLRETVIVPEVLEASASRDILQPRAARFQPAAPLPPAERSWLTTGIYLMVLPVSIGMSIMFAPVTWMLGSRSRR